MKHVVLGTAGHIDHGKTALVKALTGVNTDRFKEEQERGITIDIGFAPLVIGSDLTVGFVDVPGHERFVKNMLAGIWGIDMVLLVIAADESIKPQTREHFEICRLLRVKQGLIALTKIDLVEPDLVDLATLEARDFVRGSFLESAPIVAVSSKTGEGLDRLKEAIAAGAVGVEPGRHSSLLRLPVDRSFSMKGFGTVVTGTLVSGEISEGEEVAVYPDGRIGRVRGLQVHNAPVAKAHAGQRTAINIGGIDASSIERGDVIARQGQLSPSSLLDVKLSLLAGAPGPLKNLSRVRFHQGTSELLARVRLLGSPAGGLAPGGETFAQLRLEKPGLCLPGDRFVIRRYSPTVTIGGGEVLDANPAKHRGGSMPELTGRLERLESSDAAEAIKVYLDGEPVGVTVSALGARTGRTPAEVEALLSSAACAGVVLRTGDESSAMVIGRRAVKELEHRVTSFLEGYHRANPLNPGAPREEVREQALRGAGPEIARFVVERLAASDTVKVVKETIRLSGHQVTLSPKEDRLMKSLDEAFLAGGLNPPSIDEIAQAHQLDMRRADRFLHLLLSAGRLVKIGDGRFFHSDAIEALKRKLWEFRGERRIIDIGMFKELTGTSRKNAIPLLEHLDSVKVTRRIGSDREILPPPGG